MTQRPDASSPDRRPTIGIGTGTNDRLVDPGVARALSFAAEELGYSSVWTFDSPAGRPVADVLATLETFVSSTSTIALGAGLLGATWPLPTAVSDRLHAAQDGSGGRVVLARRWSPSIDVDRIGPMLQLWSPDERDLAPWAAGWMFELSEQRTPEPALAARGLVVRVPVRAATDPLLMEIRGLRALGASEIVLDVVADEGIDHALALYSRIAEAVEDELDRRPA